MGNCSSRESIPQSATGKIKKQLIVFFQSFARKDSAFRNLLFYLAIFIFATLIRTVPELIISTYPVGYDTITQYAPTAKSINWPYLLNNGPMFYILLLGLYSCSGADPYVLLKIIGPVLYGFLVTSFGFFCVHQLKWTPKKSFLASAFLAIQIPALRLSWDLFRNELALGFLLLSTSMLKDAQGSPKKLALVGTLFLLTVLTHPLVGILLFFIVFGFSVPLIKSKDAPALRKILLTVFPSALFFVSVYILGIFNSGDVSRPATNVIYASITKHVMFQNYFEGDYYTYSSASYPDIFASITLTFIVAYSVIVPLVLLGFKRDRILDSWTIWLLVASFSCLLIPWFAFAWAYRWMMMLVFPFTVYAVDGIERLVSESKSRRVDRMTTLTKRALASLIILYLSVTAFVYVTSPPEQPFVLFANSITSSYIPSTMTLTSIKRFEIPGVLDCLEWVNQNAQGSETLVTVEAFAGWARYNLNEDTTIVIYRNAEHPSAAISKAKGLGNITNYLLARTEEAGTEELPIIKKVFESGNIALYELDC